MKVLYKSFIVFCIFTISAGLNMAYAEKVHVNAKFSLVFEDTGKKMCKYADSTMLNEIKSGREKLNDNLAALLKKKSDLEKEISRDSKTNKEEQHEIKNIEKEIGKVEKDLNKLNGKMNSILRSVEDKYLNNGKDVVRFIGNGTIEKEDKINSNVSIINGDLVVKGKVNGDLAIINGNVKILDSGKIDGKIVLINSEFTADSSGVNFTMCGEIGNYKEYSEGYSSYGNFPFHYRFPRYHFPPTDYIDDGVVRYNRVEGLYFGLKSTKKYYWDERKKSSLYGSFGYGFSNHRWTGNLGFDRWIGNENRTEVGIEMHSIVDSKDNWLIDPLENSLAAFFIHEDFKDYFMREGWGAHISQYLNKVTRVRVDYIEDNYGNLQENTDWALFGGSKTFRKNPEIDRGRYESVILSAEHVTVDAKQYRPEGWDISASYEITSGTYSYDRLTVDIRRYQPIDLYNRINFRLMAGTSEKYLPIQRSFDIGGLGTLPAIPFKEYNGNRMALGNIEYLVGINDFFSMIFDDDFNWGDHNDLIFFYDAGWVNQASDDANMFDGFNTDNKIKQDAGIALGFDRNTIRIGAAFRLDKSNPGTFFFRISRPF